LLIECHLIVIHFAHSGPPVEKVYFVGGRISFFSGNVFSGAFLI
jgi:hypothetical protein